MNGLTNRKNPFYPDFTYKKLTQYCELIESLIDISPSKMLVNQQLNKLKYYYIIGEVSYYVLSANPARLVHSRAKISFDKTLNILFFTVLNEGDSYIKLCQHPIRNMLALSICVKNPDIKK